MGWRETLHQHLGTVRVGAVLAPLLVCAAMSLRREAFTNSTAVLVLATVIVAVASARDRYAGVLAAVSSGAWFDFFLTEPYLRFTIDDPDDIGDMVLLVLIGVAVTEIALWDEREQARASRRTGYLDGVLGTAELVLATPVSVDDLIDRVTGQITRCWGSPARASSPDHSTTAGSPCSATTGWSPGRDGGSTSVATGCRPMRRPRCWSCGTARHWGTSWSPRPPTSPAPRSSNGASPC